MDFLITTLSLINPKNFKEGKYFYPKRIRKENGSIEYVTTNKEHIMGKFTNEAPTKYLLNRKWEETYTFFDKVIILGTKECDETNIRKKFKDDKKEERDRSAASDDEKKKAEEEAEREAEKYPDCTTREYYERMTRDHIWYLITEKASAEEIREEAEIFKKYGDSSFFSFIDVDALDYGQILTEIQKLLAEEGDEKTNFYMDFTGGTRVTSLMAMMLCRWMEVNGCKMACVVYSDINNEPNTIRDVTNEYRLFDTVIAHEKVYDPDRQDESAENRDVSHSYNLTEYMEEIRRKYIDADSVDKPYIFISYSHMDYSPCQAIIQRLQSWGYRVWYDDTGIEWGAKWKDVLKHHMDQCQMAIILLSDNYPKCAYCLKELDTLSDKKKYVIRLGDVHPEEEFLEKYPFVDERQGLIRLKDNRKDFYKRLGEGLAKISEAVETRI